MHLCKRVLYCSLFVLTCLLSSFSQAQSRIDIGLHFTPQLRHVVSTPDPTPTVTTTPTFGRSGTALGYAVGGYLEYELLHDVFVRAGVDWTRKRHGYRVERRTPEGGFLSAGNQLVTINTLEVPVALVYHLMGDSYEGGFLLGVGGVLNRWVGGTDMDSSLRGNRKGQGTFSIAHHSLNAFVGYERRISKDLLVSLEPYVAYTPTTFSFESHTISEVRLEGGLAVRLLLDN